MDTHTSIMIPFASTLDDACSTAIQNLKLPHLGQFLKAAQVTLRDDGDEFDFIPPHERVLGLTSQIKVTPCHWSVGIDNMCMDNPSDLALTDEESRSLFQAIAAHLLEDGITLAYASANVWLTNSPQLNETPLASLDRVIGRRIDVWQPQSQTNKTLRRLQNEVQMLLHAHPINSKREAHGMPTINSIWFSYAPHASDYCDPSLRDSALRGDWEAWIDAWHRIDQKITCANQITLCGERNAITYAIQQQLGLKQKINRIFRPQPNIYEILQAL